MEVHKPSAAFHEPFKCSLIEIAKKAGVSLINHHHVRMFEVGTAGRMQRTVNNCTVLCQKLAPVGEELRIVVLARKMGLQARPEVDMHSVRILSRWQGSTLRFCRRKHSSLP